MEQDILRQSLPKNANTSFILNENINDVILCDDLDGDSQKEAIILYELNDKYYLMGFKEVVRWQAVFNRLTKYTSIDTYSLLKTGDGYSLLIIIGGKVKGEIKKQLMILQWQLDKIVSRMGEYIPYDKLEIRKGDNNVEQLLIINNSDTGSVVSLYNDKENRVVEQQVEKMDMTYIEGTTGYIEKKHIEEDVFLLGKYIEENDLQELYVVLTGNNKEKQYIKKIRAEAIQSYSWIIGDFLGLDKEEVFLTVVDGKKKNQRKSWLIHLTNGRIHSEFEEVYYFINTEEIQGWYEDYYHVGIQLGEKKYTISLSRYENDYLENWYTTDGKLKKDTKPSIEEGVIYAVKDSISGQHQIYIQHSIWDSNYRKIIGEIIKVYKGERGTLQYVDSFVRL